MDGVEAIITDGAIITIGENITAIAGDQQAAVSFVEIAIRFLLLALMKALSYRRSPGYQHGLICKPLRKITVILLHDVEHGFLGEFSMVPGK